MMGFSDVGIIIGPNPDLFESTTRNARFAIRDAMHVIKRYCEYEMIDLYGLFSDEVILNVLPDIPKFSNLSKGDMLLAKRYNTAFWDCTMKDYNWKYLTVIDKYVKKYPMEKDADLTKRFDTLSKREKAISMEILNSCPLVFSFQFKEKKLFNVKSKENDDRLVVDINAATLMATCTMSGVIMNTSAIFNKADASLPMNRWEAYFK